MFNKQTLTELAKDAPIPTLAGATFLGFAVNDLVLYLTLAWAGWRIVDGVLKTYWAWVDRRELKRKESADGSK